jgi:periplasmic protein TonB
MDFAQQQRYPTKHIAGISFVMLLHVVIVYALVTGLARKVVEVIQKPLETKLIEEVRPPPPPPDVPLPPPPKFAAPPPPFIPPPEVNIQAPVKPTNAIAAVTNDKPAEAPPPLSLSPSPPPVEAAAHEPVRVAPVIDAAKNCRTPEYPAASRRQEEVGTVVLRFLIDVDGHVLENKVESSSGHPRLDKAALEGLGQCRFKPGTVDGKPEQSWAKLQYVWKLQ